MSAIVWHVRVSEPPQLPFPRTERTFTFENFADALVCWVHAIDAGFTATYKQVLRVRETSNV